MVYSMVQLTLSFSNMPHQPTSTSPLAAALSVPSPKVGSKVIANRGINGTQVSRPTLQRLRHSQQDPISHTQGKSPAWTVLLQALLFRGASLSQRMSTRIRRRKRMLIPVTVLRSGIKDMAMVKLMSWRHKLPGMKDLMQRLWRKTFSPSRSREVQH